VEFATDADVVMSLLNCERLGRRRAALESAEFEREQLQTHLARVLEEAQQNEARVRASSRPDADPCWVR
jgi:hypothetical protein